MIRYKKLGYVALNVRDVERSAAFYRDVVGFTLVESSPSTAYLTCSDEHHCIMLNRSEDPGLKRIAMELEDINQYEIAWNHLSQHGYHPFEVPIEERAELKIGKAFRFADPHGAVFEFYCGMQHRPFRKQPHPVNISRLGHVILNVPNLEQHFPFYTDVLNFKPSDQRFNDKGEMSFVWMRCFPSPYHHSFGFASSETLKLQHVAFMVADINDIGIGYNRLLAQDVPVVCGPGRHYASGSIFVYFLDPDGLTIEYTLGMEEFPEVGARPPRMLDGAPETSDMWRSRRDPRMSKIGSVELMDRTNPLVL
ncbi:VOC family protein [Alicyclobacillus dauci]|uniref:VOC family protein n=1 Tax=Alicyclobacillus dauci TaxID=1475485 RepID=A0ABY6Z528_9BACL|nr:VOC family protein [Alicyclobacillus dauci]WAH37988.1 VOC family protein [Alicyclobacillus dauci]